MYVRTEKRRPSICLIRLCSREAPRLIIIEWNPPERRDIPANFREENLGNHGYTRYIHTDECAIVLSRELPAYNKTAFNAGRIPNVSYFLPSAIDGDLRREPRVIQGA